MLRPKFFGKAYKHLNRYKEVAGVLRKYGFHDFLKQLGFKRFFPINLILYKKLPPEIIKLSQWERMRYSIEDLGPAFVKLGQMMSNRPDLIPEPLIKELEKLQDEVSPVSFDKVREITEAELEAPLSQLFSYFEEKPLASASLAQVHRAVLPDGTKVVVKIQRPNIMKVIKTDLEIMFDIAVISEKYLKNVAALRPAEVIKNFDKNIKHELNFVNEALNIERFRAAFSEDPHPNIYIPKVYKELTTRKVLTMERMEGIKVSDIDALYDAGMDTKKVASIGADIFFQQVFLHGFFHADPHPGNLMVLKDHVICYLDFGMMGNIIRSDRKYMSSIFIGIQNNDTEKVVRALQKLSKNPDIKNERELEYKLKELIDQYKLLSLKEVNLGTLMTNLRAVILEHDIHVPPDFFLLMRAITITEGVGLKLDPEFNAFDELEPFLNKLLRKKINPVDLSKEVFFSSLEVVDFLKKLPHNVEEVTEKFKKGEIDINFHHRGLNDLIAELDVISNRITFAIVIAALIIGSSLIIFSGLPPTWNNIPVIGLVGFLLAGVMGFGLLISILRSGKIK